LGPTSLAHLDFGRAAPEVSILSMRAVTLDEIRQFFGETSGETSVGTTSDKTGTGSRPSSRTQNEYQDSTSAGVEHLPMSPTGSQSPTPMSSFQLRSFSELSSDRSTIRGPDGNEPHDEPPSLLADDPLQLRSSASEGSFSIHPIPAPPVHPLTSNGNTGVADTLVTLRIAYDGTAAASLATSLQIGLPRFLAAVADKDASTSEPSGPAKPFITLPIGVHIFGICMNVEISILVLQSDAGRELAEQLQSQSSADPASGANSKVAPKQRPQDVTSELIKSSIPPISHDALPAFLTSLLPAQSQLPESRSHSETDLKLDVSRTPARQVSDSDLLTALRTASGQPQVQTPRPSDTSAACAAASIATTPTSSSVSFSFGTETTPGTARRRRPLSGISSPFVSTSGPLLSGRQQQQQLPPPGGNSKLPVNQQSLASDLRLTIPEETSSVGSSMRVTVSGPSPAPSPRSEASGAELRLDRAASFASATSTARRPSAPKPPLVFVSISKGGFPLARSHQGRDLDHSFHADYAKSLSRIPCLATPDLRASHLYSLPEGGIIQRIGLCLTLGNPADSTNTPGSTGGVYQHQLQLIEKLLLGCVSRALQTFVMYPVIHRVPLAPPAGSQPTQVSINPTHESSTSVKS